MESVLLFLLFKKVASEWTPCKILRHSILSDIPFWVTFYFSGIPFWVTFHFEWNSVLSDIPFWMTFHLEWHSILSDIPFWVTFHFEWHSILSDWLMAQSQWWEMRWYRTVYFQSICESVSESPPPQKKSQVRETKHLSTDADSSTNTTVGWTKNTQKPNFFEKQKKPSTLQKLKNV